MSVERIRTDLQALARLAAVTAGQAEQVLAIARRYHQTLAGGGTLFFAGNGGSAANAQHVAAEYMVRYRRERGPFPAIALTTDSSVLTASGNDLGFDHVFSRQVEALCRPGDLLVLYSTSGTSANLVAAARAARAKGVVVVAFLGRGGGELALLADQSFVVASEDRGRIQELHLAIEHIIAGLLEDEVA